MDIHTKEQLQLLVLVFAFLALPYSFGQNTSIPETDTLAQVKLKGTKSLQTALDSLIDSLTNLKLQFYKEKCWEELIETNLEIAYQYSIHDEIISFHKSLMESDSILESLPIEDEAIYFKLKRSIQSYLGGYYSNTKQINKSIEVYKNLVVETSKLNQSQPELNLLKDLENYTLNLGANFKALGNFEQAIRYFLESLEKGEQIQNNYHSTTNNSLTYKLLGDCYLEQENFRSAEEYYQLTIAQLHRQGSIQNETSWITERRLLAHLSMVNLHIAEGKLATAQSYLTTNVSTQNLSQVHQKIVLNTTGNLLLALNQLDSALVTFQELLDNNRIQFSDYHPNVVKGNLNIANIWYQQKNYNTALNYVQEALNSFSKNYQNNSFSDNPSVDSISNKMLLLSAFELKIKCLWQLSLQDPHNMEFANSAQNTASVAVELIDIIRKDYISDEDKLFLTKTSYKIFDLAVNIAHSRKNHELAFNFSEKFKAVILQEAQVNSSASLFNDISPELLEKEQNFNVAITTLEQQRHKLENKVENVNNRAELDKKIADLKSDLFTTREKMERQSKEYAQFKANSSIVRVEDVQKNLKANQKLIEYFIGEDSLYIFLIKPDDFKTFAVPNTIDLYSEIHTLRNSLFACSLPALREKADKTYEQFKNAFEEVSYKLYSHIFGPIENEISEKDRLLIIPDGVLAYIPFSALIRTKPDKKDRLKQHNYLGDKFIISRGFSAKLQFEKRRKPQKDFGKIFIAIAPNFMQNDSGPFARHDYPLEYDSLLADLPRLKAGFGELLKNILEGRILVNRFNGDSLFGNSHSKDSVLFELQQFRIVHFSTHAQANEENGKYSFLLLKKEDGTFDSLFVGDLYNLKMIADLVVLSACETEMGELKDGEGIISLGRAFFYAGTKSILTTLWSVDEDATFIFMDKFYEFLEQGMDKDEALFEARKFLKQESQFNEPFYWGAFTIIGDIDSLPYLKDNSIRNGLIGSLAIFFLLVFGFIYRKSKQGQ